MPIPLIAAAAIGAAGAASGGYGASVGRDAKLAELKSMMEGNKELQYQLENKYGLRTSDIVNQYKGVLDSYDPAEYLRELTSTDYSKYDIKGPGEFQFDMEAATKAEINPELDAILQRQQQGIESSAGNANQLMSGATGKKIARSAADITAKEWGEARTRAQGQRTNKYQEFIDAFNNATKVNEFNRGNLQLGKSDKAEAFNIQNTAQTEKMRELNTMGRDYDLNQLKLIQEQEQLKASKAGTPGFWGTVIPAAAGGGISAFTSAYGGGGASTSGKGGL